MNRPRWTLALALLVVTSTGVLGWEAATARPPAPEAGEGAYPGHTLVAVQAYGWFDRDNGNVVLVGPNGSVNWEYDPPHAWVFDAELLKNGNVLVSMGESARAPGVECPEQYGGSPDSGTPGPLRCVRNRVVEVDFRTSEVVWEYAWYDAFPVHHEVHDADRLSNGETAIIDMGNSRAFTVNESGAITWQWRAENHISEGTEFWERYVPEDEQAQFRRGGNESDWTHMNDIDRLSNGNFRLSIRNFDVVLEVDPETNDIVSVLGRPDDHAVMKDQHNPHPLERHGTTLIADSGNDRVVEIDTETSEPVWQYDGTGSGSKLQWPRDADRLPNGNTLVTDSRNFRVLEVGPNGTVVWRFSLAQERGIVYEADRVRLPNESVYVPEEPQRVPSGRDLTGRHSSSAFDGIAQTVESWAGFVLPYWVGLPGILAILVGLGSCVGIALVEVHARWW